MNISGHALLHQCDSTFLNVAHVVVSFARIVNISWYFFRLIVVFHGLPYPKHYLFFLLTAGIILQRLEIERSMEHWGI